MSTFPIDVRNPDELALESVPGQSTFPGAASYPPK